MRAHEKSRPGEERVAPRRENLSANAQTSRSRVGNYARDLRALRAGIVRSDFTSDRGRLINQRIRYRPTPAQPSLTPFQGLLLLSRIRRRAAAAAGAFHFLRANYSRVVNAISARVFSGGEIGGSTDRSQSDRDLSRASSYPAGSDDGGGGGLTVILFSVNCVKVKRRNARTQLAGLARADPVPSPVLSPPPPLPPGSPRLLRTRSCPMLPIASADSDRGDEFQCSTATRACPPRPPSPHGRFFLSR